VIYSSNLQQGITRHSCIQPVTPKGHTDVSLVLRLLGEARFLWRVIQLVDISSAEVRHKVVCMNLVNDARQETNNVIVLVLWKGEVASGVHGLVWQKSMLLNPALTEPEHAYRCEHRCCIGAEDHSLPQFQMLAVRLLFLPALLHYLCSMPPSAVQQTQGNISAAAITQLQQGIVLSEFYSQLNAYLVGYVQVAGGNDMRVVSYAL
jgi:hypothetical protein